LELPRSVWLWRTPKWKWLLSIKTSPTTKIIEKEKVKTVVIGRAGYVHDQNVETPRRGVSTATVDNAILQLSQNLKNLGVDVEYEEEMFTTKMAENNLKERGEKNIQKYDDQEAARIILQSWLDSRKSKD
jgi:RNase H-fold protein (predicted Holliday junction resolvase)